MTDTPKLLLAHHLKTLKLPTVLREFDKVAQQCAAEGLDHVQFLARLVELELIDRERRMIERRIKAAKFPAVKGLDSFDFKAIPSLNKMQVLELARCEWIERRENVIALGPSGTGKTHVALGLGLAACQKGLAVGFITAATLVHELMEARDERRLFSPGTDHWFWSFGITASPQAPEPAKSLVHCGRGEHSGRSSPFALSRRMAGNGATSSLPRAPAKVCLLNRQPACGLAGANRFLCPEADA
jgi:hypothetical protein